VAWRFNDIETSVGTNLAPTEVLSQTDSQKTRWPEKVLYKHVYDEYNIGTIKDESVCQRSHLKHVTAIKAAGLLNLVFQK